MTTRAVDCFIIKNNKILLIEKKTGFGKGKIGAPGGKIELGESPEEAATRECLEELKIKLTDPKVVGEIKTYSKQKGSWHIYAIRSEDFNGVEKETEEASPVWFDLDKIPFDQMWQDFRYWTPFVIQNKAFTGEFYFNDQFNNLLKHSVKLVE